VEDDDVAEVANPGSDVEFEEEELEEVDSERSPAFDGEEKTLEDVAREGKVEGVEEDGVEEPEEAKDPDEFN